MGLGFGFNPTLVRLRQSQKEVGDVEGAHCFNPTLVRLRPHFLYPSSRSSSLFQSHAGSIEAGNHQIAGTRQKMFQSHAGSIEALLDLLLIGNIIYMFQSHAGSIEARSADPVVLAAIRVSIPRWFD